MSSVPLGNNALDLNQWHALLKEGDVGRATPRITKIYIKFLQVVEPGQGTIFATKQCE